MYFEKKVFVKAILNKHLRKLFFQSRFKAKMKKKIWDHIFETVLSQQFFFMFSVLGSRIEHTKNYWKPNSNVILSTSWILQIFVHFGPFLLLCGLVSNIFTMFFRDSEVCLERYDSYGDFGCLTKNQTFSFEEKFVKQHGVLLL